MKVGGSAHDWSVSGQKLMKFLTTIVYFSTCAIISKPKQGYGEAADISVHPLLVRLPFLHLFLPEAADRWAGAAALLSPRGWLRRVPSWLPGGSTCGSLLCSEVIKFQICRWDVNSLKPGGMQSEKNVCSD